MNILIRNIDIKRWKRVGKRVLVYGRRKVGKTFFIKNFTKWDKFFLIKRDGSALDLNTGNTLDYSSLKSYILENKEKRIVLDEFQRLPEDFLDWLQAYGSDLNLVLITSVLWISRRILGEGSPILGLFSEFKMDLVDERDVINFLKEKLNGKDLIETAIYLREPWIIPLFSYNIKEDIPSILIEEKNTIERLIGETFREEEREFSKVYFSILTAISSGKNKSGEITAFLFSRKIIKRQDPSLIQTYLKVLTNIGLIEKIPVFNKKYYYYIQKSPILDLYFYLEGKYGFSEIEIPKEEVKRVFLEQLPKHVEAFLSNLFSKIFGMRKGKIIEKDFEIDIALSSFRRIEKIFKVKWKRKVDHSEIKEIRRKLEKVEAKDKYIIVPDKKGLEAMPEGIKVLDSEDIIKLALQNYP